MDPVSVTALEQVLTTVNSFTPLGVIALLGVIIFYMIWRNPFKPLEKSLTEVKDNHLHELPAMAENLGKVVEILQRIEVKQGEEFSYIKARLNGSR